MTALLCLLVCFLMLALVARSFPRTFAVFIAGSLIGLCLVLAFRWEPWGSLGVYLVLAAAFWAVAFFAWVFSKVWDLLASGR